MRWRIHLKEGHNELEENGNKRSIESKGDADTLNKADLPQSNATVPDENKGLARKFGRTKSKPILSKIILWCVVIAIIVAVCIVMVNTSK